MDVEAIISGLEKLDRAQLARFEAALRRLLQGFGADASASETGEGQPVSGVVECRPHSDGTLHKDVAPTLKRPGRSSNRPAHSPTRTRMVLPGAGSEHERAAGSPFHFAGATA